MTICLALAVWSSLLGIAGSSRAVLPAPAAQNPEEPPKLPQILAFDLPPGFRHADSGKIRGFVVGYFQGDAAEPRWVLDVARELARINPDGSVRILLPLAELPVGAYSARVKIRTESAESDWSAPSPPFWLTELPSRRPRTRARSASRSPVAGRPPRALNLAPALAQAVGPLLPKGVELTDATLGFRKPVEFVSALIAARRLGIAWPDLKAKLFTESGRVRTLNAALAELRPSQDANTEARMAVEQARRLIRDARRSGR